jgi:hypothetical protein
MNIFLAGVRRSFSAPGDYPGGAMQFDQLKRRGSLQSDADDSWLTASCPP